MFRMRIAIATLFALSLSIGLATAPAVVMASGGGNVVIIQIGNVETGDILSNNTVDIGTAIQTALNVCGNQVDFLTILSSLEQNGNYYCSNDQQFFNGQLVTAPTTCSPALPSTPAIASWWSSSTKNSIGYRRS
jgi:hypothetical protein